MFAALSNTFSEELAPSEFYLSQNYPNPFRAKTVIKYCIAYRTKVTLKVYDSDGKEVEKLVDEDQNPGTYEVEYPDVETGHASSLQNQTYTYRLEAGNYKCEKQMTIQK
jgi:flagellar hook assembly protein FlgD